MTRDPRFDGKFFVGVKTTGIYCRSICPAKPKRENVEFFSSHHAAERAGYRPCLRCRPESAPRSPAWTGKTAIVQRAIKSLSLIGAFEEEAFAEKFGVSARHLRRLFIDEIGKTPKQLFFEDRLNLARKLLTETQLSASDVALASGFGSIRRFNDAFKKRFKRAPTEIRRTKASAGPLRLKLSYRPPYDYEGLLYFYRAHQIEGLEWFEGSKMFRQVDRGTIAISNSVKENCLLLELNLSDLTGIYDIVARVRAMFDLESDPILIANALECDPHVKKILKKHPGIRVPSGWDPFEIAITTILGQLVSVERGRSLVADLVRKFDGQFPTPSQLAKADLTVLKTTGIRKQTLKALGEAVASGQISLESAQDVDEFTKKLLEIKGIGPWTASYMALKVLRHTDAFPATDLILARALEIHPVETVNRMSPWRGYVASLFWREYASTLSKVKNARKRPSSG